MIEINKLDTESDIYSSDMKSSLIYLVSSNQFLLIAITLLSINVKKGFATNNPPTAIIESPKTGQLFSNQDEILFKGSATDIEDGVLLGNGLSWESDIDKRIGFGNSFMVCVA